MRYFVAGHRGMVGSALVRALQGAELILRSREKLNLCNQEAVDTFFSTEKPDVVILAAAKVGGILANATEPAQFLYENLMIQNNVIDAAARHGVQKFVFLGSSCIYPREAPQPIREEALLTGPLEKTNEGYALAKIAGLKLVQYYVEQGRFEGFSLMPCNLYGPNDNYHPEKSHVFPALIRRFIESTDEIILWGTGEPRREFMHVDDLAAAVLYFLDNPSPYPWLNVGWGKDISIRELAELIAEKTEFQGTIKWDRAKPDGTMKKCLDVSRMQEAGFTPSICLEEGVERSIHSFQVEAH